MPDIAVWPKCDNRCVMCTNARSYGRQAGARYSLKAQVRRLERRLAGLEGYANDGGGSDLTLTGGEPTLHPAFLQLLSYFRRRLPGGEITLLTNGRRLASRRFCAAFLKAAGPPFAVAVPFHGPSAAVHDRVTGVQGSFDGALAGVRNLLRPSSGPAVEARVVLHGLNLPLLGETLRFLLREFSRSPRFRAVVIHHEIEGEALRNARELELRLADSARAVNAAAPLLKRFRELRLYHFPLCLLAAPLRGLCRITQPEADRSYPRGCAGCRLRPACPGLMAAYRRRFGAGELRPVKR